MLEFDDLPELVDPVMILAFEGWNDAGEAASGAIEHLVNAWDAEAIAAIDPEDYYDFQVTRPRVVCEEEGTRRVHWRTTRLHLASPDDLGRDVILVAGIEPSFRWRAFTMEILELAAQTGVDTFITLGALLADVPHSRPIHISKTSDQASTIQRYDLQASSYEGPTGIVGVLADAANQAGMRSLSCWAAVPHYAGHTPSPKATLALLASIEEILDCPLVTPELEEEARAWERGIDELAAADDEISEYVASLEKAQDTAELPEATGDAIAKEFEKYFRRRGSDGGGP